MKKETGIVTIRGREYLTVARRVSDFRQAHRAEDGWAIITEIIATDAARVIVRAAITYNGNTVAVGHAEEDRGQSGVNQYSALENAETSAIGRALAAFGLAGQEYASADEMQKTTRQVKQLITPERFAQMLDSIKAGQYTAEAALQRFMLTDKQVEAVKSAAV